MKSSSLLILCLIMILASCAPRLQTRAELSLLPTQFDNASFSTVCNSLMLNQRAVAENQAVVPEKIETDATGVSFDLNVRAGIWQVCATFDPNAEPGRFEGSLYISIDGQDLSTPLIIQVNP